MNLNNIEFLYKKVKPYQGKTMVLNDRQSVNDIAKNILKFSKVDEQQYDILEPYFRGVNIFVTAKNLFYWQRKNFNYKAETEKNQLLLSPSSILHFALNGEMFDCKNYALFAYGILNSYIRKKNLDVDLVYRLAGYKMGVNEVSHIFVVAKFNNEDLKIDAACENIFGCNSKPYYFYDIKHKNMALSRISGKLGNPLAAAISTALPLNPMDILQGVLSAIPALGALLSLLGGKSDGEKIREQLVSQNLTANQIVAYYLQQISSGAWGAWYLNQMHELFFKQAPSMGRGWKDQSSEVSQFLARMANDAIMKYYSDNGKSATHPDTIRETPKMLFDLSKTNFIIPKSTNSGSGSGSGGGSGSGSGGGGDVPNDSSNTMFFAIGAIVLILLLKNE